MLDSLRSFNSLHCLNSFDSFVWQFLRHATTTLSELLKESDNFSRHIGQL